MNFSFEYVFWGLLIINWIFGIFVFCVTKIIIKKEQKKLLIISIGHHSFGFGGLRVYTPEFLRTTNMENKLRVCLMMLKLC